MWLLNSFTTKDILIDVAINIAVAFFLELLLGRLLYVVIGMIMFFAKIWIYSMFNINYD